MENDQSIIKEEDRLINEILKLCQESSQVIQNLTLKDTSEVKVFLPPSELLIPLFSAIYIAINEEEIVSQEMIRKRLRNPDQLLTKLSTIHTPNEILTVSQINRIKTIYDSHPNLTQTLLKISRYCHALSKWTENYIEISLICQRLSEIRNSLPTDPLIIN